MTYRLFILLLLLIVTNTTFSQLENRFGLGIDFIVPDVGLQLNGNFKVTKCVELNLGLKFNASNTLGRVVGINTYLGNLEKSNNIHSIIVGLGYDNTSSGIFSYGDDNSNSGRYLIPNNHYLIPKIGYRIYMSDGFVERIKFRDFSISLTASYNYPLSERNLIFKGGVYDSQSEKFAQGYLNGGLNFSVGFMAWIAKVN